MTSQTATVITALLSSSTVSAIIGNNIYCDEPPDESEEPCITYEEFLAPAATADNEEFAYKDEWNMEAMVRKNAWPLADAVESVMKSLGYTCNFKRSTGMLGTIHQVSLNFTQTKEV